MLVDLIIRRVTIRFLRIFIKNEQTIQILYFSLISNRFNFSYTKIIILEIFKDFRFFFIIHSLNLKIIYLDVSR